MNEKPPSTTGSGSPGLVARVRRAFRGAPWSRDEIQTFIESEVELDAEEKSMLTGVLEVSETQVREVMVPRSQMVVIDIEDEFDDILAMIVESGHSRFPVIGEDRDEVLGILLAKDLLRYFGTDAAKEVTIQKLLRSASVIPESKRLKALLKEFRASHNHMAIVVDEYGGVAGLLTIEDVLEEIVGEIEDEHDIAEDDCIKKQSDSRYTVKALTPIYEFNEYFKAELDEEAFDTIGGLIMHNLGHLPKRDETVTIDQYRFRVLHSDKRRIILLEMTLDLPSIDT